MKNKGYYFLSNDVFKLRLNENAQNRSNSNFSSVFIGIANPHLFHVLSTLLKTNPPKKIIAIDDNILQLKHLLKIRNTILESNNRIEYLQNFFKVQFNDKAIELLNSLKSRSNKYVHGATRDRYIKKEIKIWRNTNFNKKDFYNSYKIKSVVTKKGLLLKSETMGNFSEYYATFICCSPNEYDKIPFTSAFGSGFLSSDTSYLNLRTFLKKTKIELINSDITTVHKKLILKYNYFSQNWWLSNLGNPYFSNVRLKKMYDNFHTFGTNKDPIFPESNIVLLEDLRFKQIHPREISNVYFRNRKISFHTATFAKIIMHLYGNNNLEIVNVPSWIEEDNGISKLPHTKYLLDKEFLKIKKIKKYTSIVIHILLGHGSSIKNFREVAKRAFKLTNNLIVVEHNKDNKTLKNKGITLSEARNYLGKESSLELIYAKNLAIRNFIFIYKK